MVRLSIMSPENCLIVRELVASVGDELKDTLLPLPEHAQRNSYAHIWHAIKDQLGRSYKECDDDQMTDVLMCIKRVREEALSVKR